MLEVLLWSMIAINLGGTIWSIWRARQWNKLNAQFYMVNMVLLELCSQAYTQRRGRHLFPLFNQTVGRWWDEEAIEDKDHTR